MIDQKVLSKIEKLLKLAESPNENEAAFAAAKAKEYMDKHHISMMDLNGPDENAFKASENNISQRSRHQTWVKRFFSGLTRYHDCDPIYKDRYIDGKRVEILTAIGLEDDLKLLKQTYQFLSDTIENLFKAEWATARHTVDLSRNKYRRSFCRGCSGRILERMYELQRNQKKDKKEIEMGSALVIVKGALVKTFIEKTYPKLRIVKQRPVKVISDAYLKGIAAGNTVQLNKQLEN